jgi:class 3 adenylate cyclase/tetratricopeptide (TPR) repeat protein
VVPTLRPERRRFPVGGEFDLIRRGMVEARKMVTVVFSDLAGSTTLGERLDPETLRRLMARYFERMSSVLERHGGTVQEFIGDAIMAVFGIPTLHEDDGLRAVGAAAEMRAALTELNAEFESRWGLRLAARTAVNTGEIVAGDPGASARFLVGDAINVAARLQECAPPGEILLGRSTYALVRDAVEAQETEPLRLKGKAEPVRAYRLITVTAAQTAAGRRLGSRLVGRERELRALEAAFERAERDAACRLLTIVGPAGIGKSRLTAELIDRLGGRARLVKGRCLPYGDGITYWPIAEVVRDAAAIGESDSAAQAQGRIEALLGGDGAEAAPVVEGIAGALGLSVAAAQPDEIFWAIRKLLERLAADRPLIAIFDDIHWAEPTFLDLLEYLPSFSTGAPILILALARPELLEARPGWTSSVRAAESLVLDALGEAESRELIENLLEQPRLSHDIEERIASAAQGNPLFLEEMLRMLVDDGFVQRTGGDWVASTAIEEISLPPTIRALLAARLDRLDTSEKALVARAAVIGEQFWPGAIAALSTPDLRALIWPQLQALVRKELIRPGGAPFAGEDPFSFSHILIRDTAYEAILKETRAALHEAFAGWLEVRAADRLAEYEEILGYHLEQAFRCREVLRKVGPQERGLATRAARYLTAAGRRAHDRGDMQAAVKLLERSLALEPAEDPERLALALELGHALFEIGELARAQAVLSGVAEQAARLGDRRIELRARLARADLRAWTAPKRGLEGLREVSEQAIPIFEEHGDDAGLAKCWRNLATVHFFACRFGAAAEALERALHHAHRTGDRQLEAEILPGLAAALCAGPVPAEEAIRRLEALLERVDPQSSAESSALGSLGTRAAVEAWGLSGLEAMRGNFDVARALCARAKAVFQEVGQRRRLADLGFYASFNERLAGRLDEAEAELRLSYETLHEMGEKAFLSTVAADLADTVLAQGRDREAEQLTGESELLAVEEDVESQVRWRLTRAKVLAARGEVEAGEALAADAVRRASATECPNLHAAALMALAEVATVRGRAAAASSAIAQAHGLYLSKGNTVSAAGAEAQLAKLSA